MRVCVFTSDIDKKSGGPSRSVPILAKGLSLIGVETVLLTGKTDDMNNHLLDNTNVQIIELDGNISFADLENVIVRGHYDIIHAQNLWMPIYHKMVKIARKHNIPFIMTPRGCLEPWAFQGQGFVKNLKKKIAMILYQKKDLQNASCILATAQMEADNLRRLGLIPPIAIISNGIDISEYKCRNLEQKSNVKKQIVFLSRIHPKKGIEFLIEAWNKLKNTFPDWNIIIAGNGEAAYIEELRNVIKIKGLNNCIKIIPPVFGESKYNLYIESSLFVLPTYSENFGMVIAEAMSCGVPVITTNGTPWQVLNELNLGWCIELSTENLITALKNAIDLGTDQLFDKGQKCSLYVSETFQYRRVAKKNLDVYNWILNRLPQPDFVFIK